MISAASDTTKERSSDWFAECGWGVFCHYLGTPELSADDWNRRVNSFNVEALAAQIASTGAGYFFLTLGQGSGHFCAPNATYDRYAGIIPSKCSQRDLISDLYDALHPRGIALMVYAPADGPWSDPVARKGLKLTHHWSDPDHNGGPGPYWNRYRLPEFQQIWDEVCRDWSLRFGKKVRGWWIDGAFAPEERYPETQPPNYRTFADALRAGNENALVAFNTGIAVPVVSATAHEDFTAGELSGDLPISGFGPGFGDNPAWCTHGPIQPLVKGARFHVLNFLGPWWNASPPRFPTDLVTGYTRYVTQHGGVVTWDVPISETGNIPEAFIEQLRAIKVHD